MKRAALKLVPGQIERDDHVAMAEALARLYRASGHTVGEIVEKLSPTERARIAVFCYSRNHLNTVGLAIAALCSLDLLVAASSSAAAGRMLHAQSRETPAARAPHSRRPAITLAASVSKALASSTVAVAEILAQ
jgi:hypothetical protein